MANAIAPVLFVQMDDGFCVAVGTIAMPALFQSCAQFGVIVDFAVEDDPNCAGLVAEGLVAAGDVNDAEAAHSDGGWSIGIYAFVVRATMGHGGAHLPHRPGIGAY